MHVDCLAEHDHLGRFCNPHCHVQSVRPPPTPGRPLPDLVAGPANTATVTPTAVGAYQYSVTGSNDGGIGNTASTSVTVVTCTYSLFPTSQSVTAIATTGTLSVTSASDCAWTATSNVDWITITSGSSGSGNGTVVYAVAANPSGSSRTGTLTIAGQTFTVTQAGLAVPSCTLTASPSTISAGQSSTLTATCNPAATSYAWTNTGFAATASGRLCFADGDHDLFRRWHQYCRQRQHGQRHRDGDLHLLPLASPANPWRPTLTLVR